MSMHATIGRLDEALGPVGFKRHQLTWNRRSDSFVDVIDLQLSKPRDAVTVNVGVMDPDVFKLCWGNDPPPVVDEPSCTVRARVGQLVGDKDVWWQLDQAETPANAVDAVIAHVFPFVERMHSREAMAEFLIAAGALKQKYPPPIIYLALLRSLLGDQPGACSMLDDLHQAALGAWRARVSEIAESLGCP